MFLTTVIVFHLQTRRCILLCVRLYQRPECRVIEKKKEAAHSDQPLGLLHRQIGPTWDQPGTNKMVREYFHVRALRHHVATTAKSD